MSGLLKPLKLVKLASEAGRVTRKYPYEPPLISDEFRGKIEIDASKCIGCGACVLACPPNALELVSSEDRVAIRYFVGRCIFCWRCVDVCPVGAIKGTREFELATNDISDLYVHVVHKRAGCPECGGLNGTEKMKVFVYTRVPVTETYVNDCPQCRKNKFLTTLAASRGGAIE